MRGGYFLGLELGLGLGLGLGLACSLGRAYMASAMQGVLSRLARWRNCLIEQG